MADEYFTPLVMTPESVLHRFSKVRKATTGRDGIHQWTACCPAHNDRNPSLCIGLTQDGRWLFYCRTGCSGEDVAASVGLSMTDLFPKNGIDEEDGKFRGFGGIRGVRGVQKPYEERVADTALDIAQSKARKGSLTDAERKEAIMIRRRKKGQNSWPVSVDTHR